MQRRALLLCLLLLPVPFAVAGDGSVALRFDVTRADAGPAALALDVAREDGEGIATGREELGARELPAGASVVEVSYLPALGPGRYTVALLVDGARAGEAVFDADDASARTTVRFDVADEPTFLNLTRDDVNADGKAKSPGEPLLTRATLEDGNGLDELDAVRWTVVRDGAPFESGTLAPAPTLELRYERAIVPAGPYALRLEALKGGAVVANATRTFAIREVAATFAGGAVESVVPDEDRAQQVDVVLHDRNGAPGPGTLEARVYRGSARVDGWARFAAGNRTDLSAGEARGLGNASYPLTLAVLKGAPPGAYRVSLYLNATLLASLPFDVLAVPSIVTANASVVDGRLRLDVRASAPGVATLRLTDGAGATVEQTTPLADGNATFALAPPRRGVPLAWTLSLRAREGGPVVDERNGTWTAAADGPALSLVPAHGGGRLPAAWRLDAGGADLAQANATFRFARWDGAPETRLAGRIDGDRVRVTGAPDAGRHTATLTLAWPDGRVSEATWSFDAGAWARLRVGEPVVSGREARVPVVNEGGLPLARLVVEAPADANVTLVAGGARHAPTMRGGRAVFEVPLAPQAAAELVVALPPGPMKAGARSVPLRVLAQPGGAA